MIHTSQLIFIQPPSSEISLLILVSFLAGGHWPCVGVTIDGWCVVVGAGCVVVGAGCVVVGAGCVVVGAGCVVVGAGLHQPLE